MAELIPLEYRVAVARQRQIRRWAAAGVLVALLAGGSLTFAFCWRQSQAAELKRVTGVYTAKSILLSKADVLSNRRLVLAERMQNMEQLTDDRLLLSLLRNVFSCFSDNDCLDYIRIDAHSPGQLAGTSGAEPHKYLVRISGVTASDATHAELVERLTRVGSKSFPPMTVSPESLRREPHLDGQVMRFQIVCEQPTVAKSADTVAR
jgi:hypothetical protein